MKTDNSNHIKLDYSLQTVEERQDLVNKILESATADQLTPSYLDKLSDYLVIPISKEEKKEKLILTDNRMSTINKRETSFQSLEDKFDQTGGGGPSGGDGVYHLFKNNKSARLTNKFEITKDDVEKVPGLKELRQSISRLEKALETAEGRDKYIIKKQLIDMRKDQYILKQSYRNPVLNMGTTPAADLLGQNSVSFYGDIYIDDEGNPQTTAPVSVFREDHVFALLKNLYALEADMEEKLGADMHYMIQEFRDLVKNALSPTPILFALADLKMKGFKNDEIHELLLDRFGRTYSPVYISQLWKNKIPKVICKQARREALEWYYTFKEFGTWKRCGRCKEVKLAHPEFFPRNNAIKSGFYSICKECRREDYQKKKASQQKEGC